ncbi:MFS transporter [Streptomyces sp. 769]|uniref:MFS transporter n=1 Tax=Streptomyces sp. 769 TaxID=1262452 RepID=UPI0005822C8E|nr:MFS transporter [Streptomyces sp. 769]AJC57372.1 major facilitator family transporter [Streptomyces sp. 769]
MTTLGSTTPTASPGPHRTTAPRGSRPASPPAPAPAGRSPLKGRLAVLAVTLGIFTIVTTEILPIGLLTRIGADFGVSDGTAGLMMTLPGFLAACAAPTVTLATARIDRRLMLCAFVALLALANFLAATAPVYGLVLLSRVLVGVVIGGFWSIGVGLAERLVPAESAGRATAVIFSAVPLGSVIGVPAGTFLGDLAGWRIACAAVGALAVAVLVLTALVVPALPAVRATGPALLRRTLRGVHTRFALLMTFLIVLAHFGAYTYVTPFLERTTHLATAGTVTAFLLVYGLAGVVGNFAGGAVVARRPRLVFGAAAGLTALATLLLPVLGRGPAGALALLVVWGVAYGAVPVASQTWFAKAAPGAPEAASVLFTASFQATLSLGALAGGMVVDRTSPSVVMTLGGATAALVVLAAWLHRAKQPAWPRS